MIHRLLIQALFVISFVQFTLAQIDPHAGMIGSLLDHVQPTTSSTTVNSNDSLATDGNTQTFWSSNGVLPSGFLTREDVNILLGLGASSQCISSNQSADSTLTDGSVYTAAVIQPDMDGAWVHFDFTTTSPLRSISLKGSTSLDTIEVWVYRSSSDSLRIGIYTPSDNYSLRRFDHIDTIVAIRLSSPSSFTLSEIGAIAEKPTEYMVFDMGQIQNVGWIESRHYSSSDVDKIDVFLSTDSIQWQWVAVLDPDALGMIINRFTNNIPARYLKMVWTLREDNWKKAKLWELKVYDKFGKYGPMPSPQVQQNTMADMLGVNGIWGWGHNSYSDLLQPGEGPQLFQRMSSHTRNYHNLSWDVSDPDNVVDFDNMPGSLAQNWLDWDREYVTWKSAGMDIYTSIQFTNATQPQSTWDNPFQAAFQYGFNFSSHFGSNQGNNLIKGLEVGNEPWDYPASFYTQVLWGMAKGAKMADPSFDVFPCALQAVDSSSEITGYKNYAGYRLIDSTIQYLDGFNAHHYSYYNDSNGIRRATYPENYISTSRGILNDLRFMNQNMPGKKMYVTEWGWDSDGAGEACTHNECVSELAQAIYGIRYAFMLQRLGISRMHWFFYANLGSTSSLYTRSGLTGSSPTFQEKSSFTAFEALLHLIGDRVFIDTLAENDQAWIYELGDSSGQVTHLVAWRPTEANDTNTFNMSLPYAMEADSAGLINGQSTTGTLTNKPAYSNGQLTISVRSIPTIIRLKPVISTTEYPNEKTWQLHPNPTDGRIYIQGRNHRKGKVNVIDVLGRIYQSYPSIPSSISLRPLQAGLYYIQIDQNGYQQVHAIQKL